MTEKRLIHVVRGKGNLQPLPQEVTAGAEARRRLAAIREAGHPFLVLGVTAAIIVASISLTVDPRWRN